jgi:hypothetical protein
VRAWRVVASRFSSFQIPLHRRTHPFHPALSCTIAHSSPRHAQEIHCPFFGYSGLQFAEASGGEHAQARRAKKTSGGGGGFGRDRHKWLLLRWLSIGRGGFGEGKTDIKPTKTDTKACKTITKPCKTDTQRATLKRDRWGGEDGCSASESIENMHTPCSWSQGGLPPGNQMRGAYLT